MTTYTTTTNGVKVTCNQPFTYKPVSGTAYQLNMNFNNSLSATLAGYGAQLTDLLDPNIIKSTIESKTGSTITDMKLTESGKVVTIGFKASSPFILDVVGLIFMAIGIAIGVGILYGTLAGSAIGAAITAAAFGTVFLILGLTLDYIETWLTSPGGGGGILPTLESDVQTFIIYAALFGAAVFVMLFLAGRLFSYVKKPDIGAST